MRQIAFTYTRFISQFFCLKKFQLAFSLNFPPIFALNNFQPTRFRDNLRQKQRSREAAVSCERTKVSSRREKEAKGGAVNSPHGGELIFKKTHTISTPKTSNIPPALLAKEDTHNREPLAVYYRAVRSQPKCNKLPIRAKCLPPPRSPSRGTRDGPAKVPVQMHPQTHRYYMDTHTHIHARARFTWRVAPYIDPPQQERVESAL